MIYDIVHRTTHEYASSVAVSHHVARLEPRESDAQSCSACSIHIDPRPATRKSRQDYFGNRLCFFSVQEMHHRLDIVAKSRVRVCGGPPPKLESSPAWETVAGLFRDPVSPGVVEPYQYVFDSPHVRASAEWADYALQSFPADRPLLEGARELTARIFRDFKYDPGATTVATTAEEVLARRRGVCQDFAHVAIAGLRSIGLPARYVGGYLRTHAPPGAEKLVGADASHAWFSIFCPGTGWVDFDPTNNLLPSEEHITVACGRDFGDVSPFSGILTGGGEHTVEVSVDVTPVEAA
ncbi:MAG: transglutaminase family protein [Verrucomicrobiota bacterium]